MAKKVLVKTQRIFDRIPDVVSGLANTIDLVLAKGAADIQGAAIDYIRDNDIIDTGNLMASQGSGPADNGSWMAYSGADYSIEVHDGTSRMPGRPFLLQAYLLVKPSIMDAAARAVEILAGGGGATNGE